MKIDLQTVRKALSTGTIVTTVAEFGTRFSWVSGGQIFSAQFSDDELARMDQAELIVMLLATPQTRRSVDVLPAEGWDE